MSPRESERFERQRAKDQQQQDMVDDHQGGGKSGDDEKIMENQRSTAPSSSTSSSVGERRHSSVYHFLEEAARLFHVGIPSIMMQFSLYWIFPVSASAVGRKLGPVELAGFSLGALIGNMTCLSIMEGSLTAADTLMPRAFGAEQYSDVGRLAIRATVVGLFLLSIPVVPLCMFSGWILETLGQDTEASYMAQEWIQMYFLGALPNLLFRVLMRFMLSQHKPWPLVISSTIPSLLIHPILLKLLIPTMGLSGSALSIALTQWLTFVMLLFILWIRPTYHDDTWPQLTSWKFLQESLEWSNTARFLRLAVGGILSMNEWWFFEIMCFIAGSFGVESLDAHTIAYNLVPLLFMLPLGVSIGLAVRMGNVFALEPLKARMMAAWCMAFMAVVGVSVSFLLHYLRYEVIAMFTHDEDVTELALGIWPYLCYYMFLIYVMGISLAIMRALGMQWRAAGIISGSLYGLTLPAVIYFANYRGGGLLAQWKVLPCCYTILQIALASGYLFLDWDRHSKKVRESIALMAVGQQDMPTEETPLIVV